ANKDAVVIAGGTNVSCSLGSISNRAAIIGYTMRDGNGGNAATLTTMTVSALNDAPVAVDDAANTAEDVPVTISPLDNDSDPDGDSLTISIVTATNGTAVVVGGTNVLFTPATNFNGTGTIGNGSADSSGETDTAR